MKLTFIQIPIILALTLLCRPTFAQYEVSASAGVEAPMGNLTWVYKPAVSYNLSFYKTKRTWKPLKGGYGARVGYYKFNTSVDSLNYLADAGPGISTFTDYSVLMVAMCTKWNFEFNESIEGFFGLDVGYYYSKYEYTLDDPGLSEHGSNTEGKFAVAPKIGLAFNISDEIGLFIQTRYNLCMRIDDGGAGTFNGVSGGSSQDNVYNGQTNFGRTISIWSNNIGVYYRFRT